MPVDFFSANYITEHISDTEFGIMDNSKAYIVKNDIASCNAIIINNIFKLNFVPVDNHIKLRRENREMAKRCDCMLYDDNKTEIIIFIELKQRKNAEDAFSDVKEQLKETISFFNRSHPNHICKKKCAFVANSVSPSVPPVHNTSIYEFLNETGFVLYVKHKIDIQALIERT